METDKNKYSQNGMREGNPGNINPEDQSRTHPAKEDNATEHLDINESDLGRNQGQIPADEHIEDFSQIIPKDANHLDDPMEQTLAKEFDTDDFKRVDERDNGDSSEDWDAEKSRTGRHK